MMLNVCIFYKCVNNAKQGTNVDVYQWWVVRVGWSLFKSLHQMKHKIF